MVDAGWLVALLAHARRWLLCISPVPLTSFDQCASCLYLEPPRYSCHGLADSVRDGVLLVVLVAVVEVLQSCSSCSSSLCRFCSVPSFSSSTEFWTFHFGHLVGDAQCTLCTGPWSSTGPVSGYCVERPLLCYNRCRGRLCSRMFGSTVLRLYLVRYGRISHIFYVKAVL